MVGSLLDVVFPLRCAGCAAGPWPFCPTCRDALVVLGPPWCARCGRPSEEPLGRCRDCPPAAIEVSRAPFLYEGPARAALHRLKFTGWRSVARALGAAMAEVAEESGFPADSVTWVPLSRRRRAVRGFDQARALALAVGERLGVPAARLLRRVRDTPPQARRGAEERRRAMAEAFRPAIGRGRSPPARVLLVDDVLTTGTTAAACAGALRRAGVSRVGLVTAARALRGPLPARCYDRVGSRLGLWLPGDTPR